MLWQLRNDRLAKVVDTRRSAVVYMCAIKNIRRIDATRLLPFCYRRATTEYGILRTH